MTHTRSTIMDTNSFRPGDEALLDDRTRSLLERRARVLGPGYRLFYREPVHLVRGLGAYLWDADGEQYLDVYNNVASIGHAHPAVVRAMAEQAATLNTHTRYLHDGVVDYAEDLLSTMPSELGNVMFTCSGSEANDLAVRVAAAATGGTGVLVTAEAYHGNSALVSGLSPALGSAQPLDPTVRLLTAPDRYRVETDDLGRWFAREVERCIDELEASGIRFSALMVDSLFSSDGVLSGPRGFLREAVDVVHRRGGILIADEVQPGFARTGESFWGFGRHAVVPDLVTLGKPMGNGIPVAGLVARPEILEAFAGSLPYFNTFGGNPVSIAAAQAVLTTIREEGLQEHSRTTGDLMRAELSALATRHPAIGDIRGAGLFTGLELVEDRATKMPDKALALGVIEGLRRRRVLTSVAGPHGNVLKLRPTLAFGIHDIDWLVQALDDSLTELGA